MARSITIDTTSPLFSNISPAEGTIVNSPATISGRVIDAAPVTVKVNDITAVAAANGDFSAQSVPLLEGENQLLLTATDAAGNQNDLTITLLGQDRTPPDPLAIITDSAGNPVATPTAAA